MGEEWVLWDEFIEARIKDGHYDGRAFACEAGYLAF